MSSCRASLRSGRGHRGFTLVELLFAIIILLFGVLVALRVFPPGFEVFNENQRLAAAQTQTDGLVTLLSADPDGMPDAILPLDYAALNANITAINLSNLTAVAYTDSTAVSWAYTHRFPSDTDPWPGWQPLNPRLFRRVVGEKFTIPADIRSIGTDNIAILPKYTPRFSPLQAGQPLHVYDVRYKQVAFADISSASNTAENYAYALDNTDPSAPIFYFAENAAQDRDLRLTFLCTDTEKRVRQLTPAVWEVTNPPVNPVTPTQGQQVTLGGSAVTATVTRRDAGGRFYYEMQFNLNGWKLMAGSEQINRAYHRVTWSEIPDPVSGTGPADLANLAPGRFYLWPENGQPNEWTMLLSPIIFSKQDAGKRVKIDYTVADWGILRDDVTVDADGMLHLSVRNPKVGYKPRYPREPHPWGLFEPMNAAGTSVVMTLVDTITGSAYDVLFDPARKNADYGLGQHGYFLYTRSREHPEYRTAVDMAEADRGRIRLVRYVRNGTNWVELDPAAHPEYALEGQAFRVYYRGQRDWMTQVFKAPAAFGVIRRNDLPSDADLTPADLGLHYVTRAGAAVAVSGLYAGQVLSFDYLHRDLCRVVEVVDGATVRVDNASRLAVGDSVKLWRPGNAGETATVLTVTPRTREVTLVGTYSVDLLAPGTFVGSDGGDDGPLWRTSGEQHTVPPPDSRGLSTIVLKHWPENDKLLTVRGISMTVRALWTQPRRGEAYIVDPVEDPDTRDSFPTKTRPLGERWRAHSVTVTLPAAGQ